MLNLGCALAQPVSQEGPQQPQEVAGGKALSQRATELPAILYPSSKVPKSAEGLSKVQFKGLSQGLRGDCRWEAGGPPVSQVASP